MRRLTDVRHCQIDLTNPRRLFVRGVVNLGHQLVDVIDVYDYRVHRPLGLFGKLAMAHIGEASHINADRVSRSEQTAHTLREKGSHLTELVSLFRLKR